MNVQRILKCRLSQFCLVSMLTLTYCKEKFKTDYINLQNFQFSSLTFRKPGNFVDVHVDTLIKIWQDSELNPKLVEKKVKYFELLKEHYESFAILADTNDFNNSVLIFQGPRLNPGKWVSKEIYLALDRKLRSEAREQGFSFEPIENSYLEFTNGHKLLKIKFQWSDKVATWQGTEYILTFEGNSFGIVVSNQGDDFEGLVRLSKISP